MKEIKIEDKLYPNLLKKIENPPQKLFVEGDEKILKSKCFSIVGSRTCTEYGKKWCEKFANELSKYNLTIVSGMAVGIDAIAHESIINSGGRTIAVLPCGLENIYPQENKYLYKRIIENGGCVITEYESNVKANSKRFLERNRIVSGISIGILVIEAAFRSGTSVTARLANSQKRKVFCIPRVIRQYKKRWYK